MTDETKALESRVRQDLTMLTHAYDRTVDAQAARIAVLEALMDEIERLTALLQSDAAESAMMPTAVVFARTTKIMACVARTFDPAALASGATPPDDVD